MVRCIGRPSLSSHEVAVASGRAIRVDHRGKCRKVDLAVLVGRSKDESEILAWIDQITHTLTHSYRHRM